MTDGTLPNSSGATPGNDSTGQPVESLPSSVEEVEAFWRNRFSQRDRAHNAETAALREQINALQQRSAGSTPTEAPSPEAARVAELEAALAAERARAEAANRKAQYPLVGSILGDDIANVDPAKLAALEASYESGARGPMIDPNSAPRNAGVMAQPQKSMNEKSKDELLADLRKIAPAYQQAAKEGLL